MTQLISLILSNNKIVNIDSLRNVTLLDRLDLSNNQIRNLNGLQDMNSLEYLKLSNNQIQKIDSLEKLKKLISLHIFHNPISNLTFNIISPIRTQIYLSNYNMHLLNESINKFNEIYVFNLKYDSTFSYNILFNHKRFYSKSSKFFKYYSSSFLITLNNSYDFDDVLDNLLISNLTG